jgi:hypothetical protein
MGPADCCVYKRPFADEFGDCPAYDPEPFVAKNMRDLPLASIWTCAHLAVGEYPGQRGHLYARCLLGDTASRRQALLLKLRSHSAA